MASNWKTLGLLPGSDENEIKKRFRELALKYHPDKNPGKEKEAQVKFIALEDAYRTLLVVASRKVVKSTGARVPKREREVSTTPEEEDSTEEAWRSSSNAWRSYSPRGTTPDSPSPPATPPAKRRAPKYDPIADINAPWPIRIQQLAPKRENGPNTTPIAEAVATLTTLEKTIKEASEAVEKFSTWLDEERPPPPAGSSSYMFGVDEALQHARDLLKATETLLKRWKAGMDGTSLTLRTAKPGRLNWWGAMAGMVGYKLGATEMNEVHRDLIKWIQDATVVYTGDGGMVFDYDCQKEFVKMARRRAPVLEVVN